MDARTLLGEWLGFARTASVRPGDTHAVMAGFTISALLGDLLARDPERADWLPNQIHLALADGSAAYRLIVEWTDRFDAELPVQMVPLAPATPAQAHAALDELATWNTSAAEQLRGLLADPDDPTDPTAVVFAVKQLEQQARHR